jgi:deazaflavin-dependent oxidoreductase (nitroreductase family)
VGSSGGYMPGVQNWLKKKEKMGSSLTHHQPKGILRMLFRTPIWFYRAHMGWLLGKRFLMLTHVGRKSRQLRQVVLEVVSHDERTGAYFVAVGWRGKADWFKNIQATPAVQFTVGTQTFPASAQIVDPAGAAGIFLDYARRHPLAFQEISHLMMGKTLKADLRDCSLLAQSVPLVILIPAQNIGGL